MLLRPQPRPFRCTRKTLSCSLCNIALPRYLSRPLQPKSHKATFFSSCFCPLQVLLGLQIGLPIDMWSLGCVVAEVRLSQLSVALFGCKVHFAPADDDDDDPTHLYRSSILGTRCSWPATVWK